MNEKLKPCPFCGGKANVGVDDFNNKYQEFKTLYTTNIHHNVVVKKGTDGIKIRISNNDKDNK